MAGQTFWVGRTVADHRGEAVGAILLYDGIHFALWIYYESEDRRQQGILTQISILLRLPPSVYVVPLMARSSAHLPKALP